KNIPPEAARDFSGQAHRRQFQQTENPRAVSEPDLFRGGMYGAEAAARGYFGKSARDMTLAECATLAGLIKSPNRLSPWSDRANSRETRDFALDRMRDLGFISREQCATARAEKIPIGSRQNAQGQTY